MEEFLFLSDVMRKYQGRIKDEVLNQVVRHYDNKYYALIKRSSHKKSELEQQFFEELDKALENLLLN